MENYEIALAIIEVVKVGIMEIKITSEIREEGCLPVFFSGLKRLVFFRGW